MAARLAKVVALLALACGCYEGPLPASGSQVVRADVPGADVAILSVDGAAVVWIFDR